MQQILSFGLVTGKHAMGSGQPLGSLMPEYPDTQESDTINVDAPEKDVEHVPVLDRKKKRAGFMEEELSVFSSMTEAVKEVASAIRESKSVDVHPKLYSAVMDQIVFSPEDLMVALSHLLDSKAQGVGFVAMGADHKVLWLRTWLGKHYYYCCFYWRRRRP
ncbi:hypothetical protein VPH35_021878 [Triticum aestivum]